MELEGISLEEFRDYDSILYVKADTKRLKAVEYVDKKKKVLLKKNVLRERYDKIKIEMEDEKLKDHVWNLLKKKETGRKWFEKFRYEKLDNGFIVGGKDKGSNEELLKRHLGNDDLVFHTEMKGSPFFILKNSENKEGIFRAAMLTAYY